ncbi:hypothetical protein AYO08_10415 [Pseudomonas putida]|uniref:hypothetical protein n=1 Tax=Pseudomonas putida TaxID=303 RepID=UPI0007DC0BEB|nr:hypothetical protein [Pseudomonas putida]OAS07736.1 hypothetical protein AYO08_10415 [Pseudomonas putida]QNV69438.1 hypothetical protein F7661_28410 [Pseudomonas sp. CFA]
MNFHDTAIKYATLAAAAVDSRGNLLHQVGSYPSGTVRDAELAELEQAYRSTVIAELVSSSELKATAHVVLSQDDDESGADAEVIGICFDSVSAEGLADEAASEMAKRINQLLANDMGADFEPVSVTQTGQERIISNSNVGILGAIRIKTASVSIEGNGCGLHTVTSPIIPLGVASL